MPILTGIEGQAGDRHHLHPARDGHPRDVLQPHAGEDRRSDPEGGQKARAHPPDPVRRHRRLVKTGFCSGKPETRTGTKKEPQDLSLY